ncbi:sensor domain-containing diguanylate cyclase [Psychromonas ossibalaenae]|uniref:sensor domain-containing diguanylate cyclase n=1 Tax=Psychromonas ossibalaenae TaxID=444922 RepID=UPI00037933A6|nr:diguanylate cyclase [Psychromonas ossibalaenae]
MNIYLLPNKKYHLIFALYFVIFGVIVALLTSFITYHFSIADIDKEFQEKSNSNMEFSRVVLQDYIVASEMIVSSITHNKLIEQYIKSNSADDKRKLQSLFQGVTYANNDIVQLRYIDVSGRENIRIERNRKTKELHIVNESDLQDKKQRYYYNETAALDAHQFWHSNIDLNIENNKIEQPLNPTFRVAAPLYIDGRFEGIVIVNLMFEKIINLLTHSENFNIYLTDQKGEIISQPDRDRSWSRYFKSNPNMYALFPEYVEKILSQEIFSAEKIYSYSLGELFKNNESIKIIFVPEQAAVQKLQKANIVLALLLAFTVILISIPLSGLVSIIPAKLQSQLAKAYKVIRDDAAIIDKNVMIVRTDKQGTIQNVSTWFTKVTGYQRDEVLGKNHNILRHLDTTLETYTSLWQTILKGNTWEGQLKDLNKSGEEIWLNTVITPEFKDNNTVSGFTAISQDITAQKEIEKMSITDSLTGLYNRHKLDQVLSAEISRFKRYQAPFSLLLFDVDYFKKINDCHGHLIGDETLIALAKLLQDNARETDWVIRWGGEEFLIIAAGTDIENTCFFAEKLRLTIAEHHFSVIGKATASCGVAQYREGESAEELLSRVDSALYQAKLTGRNKVVKSTSPA